MKRRISALVLSIAIILSMLTVCIFSASAATYGNLTYKVEGGKVIITGCSSDATGTLTIPAKISGYPVTGIEHHAFMDCSSLKRITLPSSIKSIGAYAFMSCSSLTSINIPAGVATIEAMAFSDCYSLTSINVPSGVTKIDRGAFASCSSLASITLPVGITKIGYDAFLDTAYYAKASNWKNGLLYIGNYLVGVKDNISGAVTVKSGTKCIADYAFSHCSSIKSITISNGITNTGDNTFYKCSGLTSISLPGSLKSIGKHAFEGCSSLVSINIPSSVTSIGGYAFLYCFSLAHIIVPNSVTQIGEGAFAECKSLGAFTVPTGVKSIEGYTFVNCSALTDIFIPKGVQSVGDSAFDGCSALKNVWYGGTKQNKSAMNFDAYNQELKNATWHYSAKEMKTAKKFIDIKKQDWYFNAVDYAVKENLFSGTSAYTFSPKNSMTRAMFVTVLGRLDGKSVNHNVKTAFTDVKKNQYYTGYVKWAYENEIVSGTSKTKFEPNANITREQICAMMQRYSNYAGIRIKQYYKVMTFTDAAQISSWAKDAVRACQQGGLVTGEKVGASYRFRPKGNATRAEVATIIMNFAEKHK